MKRKVVMMAVALSVACRGGDAGRVDPDGLVRQDTPLSQGVLQVNEFSRAENVWSPEGIAGTVVRIDRDDAPACPGTVVNRNLVVTWAGCVGHWEFGGFSHADRDSLSVYVPQENKAYQVAGLSLVGAGANPENFDVALVYLADIIPQSAIERTAPVFLGDINKAFQDKRFDWNDSWFISFAPKRTMAMLRSNAPYILLDHSGMGARFDNVGGPMVDDGDLGGPFFIYDRITRNYTLIGILTSFEVVKEVGSYVALSGSVSFFGNLGFSESSTDHAATTYSRLGVDEDEDGIPDAFDNCSPAKCRSKGIAIEYCYNADQRSENAYEGSVCECNWGRASLRENHNGEAEDAVAASLPELPARWRPDYCDAVPLLKFAETRPTSYARYEIPALPQLNPRSSSLYVEARSTIGSGAFAPAFEAKAAFRFCGCYRRTAELSRGECLESAICDASLAAQGDGNWKKVPAWEPIPFSPPLEYPVSGETGVTVRFLSGQDGPPSTFRWGWQEQVAAGEVPGRITRDSHGTYDETLGLFASGIVWNDDAQSRRDGETKGNLRAVLSYVKLPNIHPDDKFIRWNDLPRGGVRSKFWLWPRALALGGEDLERFLTHPVPVAPWGGELLALADRGDAIVVTDLFSEVLSQELTERSSRWEALVPTGPLGASSSSSGRFVLLPTSGNGIARPLVIEEHDRHLRIRDEDEVAGLLAEASSGSSPFATPEGGRSVYVPSEDAVFFIGAGSTGLPGIRKADLLMLEMAPVITEIPPSDLVLAAAHDSAGSCLYWLDKTSGHLRLVKHELDSGASYSWSMEFDDVGQSFSLHVLEGGDLILVEGTTERTRLWRLNLLSKVPHVMGQAAFPKPLFSLPSSSDHGLVFPFDDGETASFWFLTSSTALELPEAGGLFP